MENIAGKTILITGAAMGMGRLYAQLAVAEKARAIVLWDINAVELEKTATELRSQGGKVYTYVVDVSKGSAIQEAAAKVKADVGHLEILINNAGIVVGRVFTEHSAEQIERTLAINSAAPMHIVREFLPDMIQSGSECRILNIASAAGLISNPRMTVYCASKWAMVGWSDSLRIELRQLKLDRVRVTTICPSYISTGMFDGVKAPLFTPILTPEYVVSRAWAAMKSGKPMLTMPYTIGMLGFFRGVLPLPVFEFFAEKVFGVYNTMDQFKGHAPGKN